MLIDGYYTIFYKVSGGPDPVFRPLGLTVTNDLAILPNDTDPPQWKVVTGEDTAEFFLFGKAIAPLGGSRIGGGPAYRWYITECAEPEPDVYAVLMHRPDADNHVFAWNPPKDISDVRPAAIELEGIGYPFHFRLVSQD